MAKLKEKDIYNICIKKEITDKLLDYENNKSYFKNEDINEILSCLLLFSSKNIKRSIKKSKMIIEKYFISNIISIYKKYIFNSNKDNTILLKQLYEYKSNLIYLKLNGMLDDNKEYKELAIKQIKEINTFIDSLNIKDKMYRELKSYDKYMDNENELSSEEYYKLNNIIKYAVYPIPQRYIDLFFKETIKRNILMSEEVISSVIGSIIHNYSYSNDTFCYFRLKNESSKSYGSYENNLIIISILHYKDIMHYKEVDYSNFLETVFHELRHLYQINKITTNKELSYDDIIMLMDYLLYNTLHSKYYDSNYDFISSELDARIYGRSYADRYLNILDVKSNLSSENEEDIRKHKIRNRKYNGKFYTIDELFRTKIEEIYNISLENDIDIFKRHPVLNIMFTKDLKRRTTVELFHMRDEYNNKLDNASKEEKEDLEIKIHNINEILYKQILSVEETISDYKELISDKSIDEKEKELYLESMIKVIELRSKKENIKSIKRLINIIKENISKSKEKSLNLSKNK